MTTSSKLLGLLATMIVTACNEPSNCREVSRVLLDDPSDPLSGGGTFANIQAMVSGTRSGPLHWLENEQYARGFPPPGESRITVTIAAPRMAWEVTTKGFNLGRYERLACPYYWETELELELHSDDGVLHTSIVVPVKSQVPDSVTIWLDVTGEDLGNLPWDPIDPDAELELYLSYGTLTGPEGALRYSYEQSDDAGNGLGFTTDLATFTLPDRAPERTTRGPA